jgi:uncharacterized small protein (DUF1192 family)
MTRYEWDTRYEALTAEVERLKAELNFGHDIVQANADLGAEVVRLRAELAQFRPVTLTEVAGLAGGLVKIDGEWGTIPLKVYVKDDHA